MEKFKLVKTIPNDPSSNQFKLGLANGLIFIPNATFKPTSIVTDLDITVEFAQVVPTVTSVIDRKDGEGNKWFTECIAFSIAPDNKVVYKYQLFFEDITLRTTASSNPAVGIYLRSIDSFYDLLPKYSKLPLYRLYTTNFNLESEAHNIADGSWALWKYDGLILIRELPACGDGNSRFVKGSDVNRWLIFKTKRINNGNYKIYVTSSGYTSDSSRIKDNWYGLNRFSGYAGKYFDNNWNVQPRINQIGEGNKFFSNSPDQYVDPKTAELQLIARNNSYHIGTERAFLGWDCNLCMFGNNPYKEDRCSSDTNGDKFGGYIIQPSMNYILNRLLNDDSYRVLKVNLCVSKDPNYYIDPTTYRATNEFFVSKLSEPQCKSAVITYCSDVIDGFSNLNSSICKNYCANNANCYDTVTTYCSGIGNNALTGSDKLICGCNMNTTVVQTAYDKYVKDLTNKSIQIPTCPELPQLLFPPCITAGYKGAYKSTTQNPPKCDSNIVNCVSNIDVTNNGSISGAITANVSADCKSFVNQVTGGLISCTANSDCPSNAPLCSSDKKCIQCNQNTDCSGGTPICKNNACIQCEGNSNCTVDNPFCVQGNCEECISTTDCGTGKKCFANSCVNECDTDIDCGTGKICNNGVCEKKSTSIVLYGVGILGIVLILILISRRKKRF